MLLAVGPGGDEDDDAADDAADDGGPGCDMVDGGTDGRTVRDAHGEADRQALLHPA